MGDAFASPAPTQQPADKAEPQTQAPEAPVEYAFKAPEGITLGEIEGKAKALASELKLPPDKAQAFIDMAGELAANHAKTQTEAQLEQVRAEVSKWVESAKVDPEIGGDKLKPSLASANAAVSKFGTPELSALLKATGLGNHPEFIRVFAKVGQLIAEDKVVGSRAEPTANAQPAHVRLYGGQKAA